MLTDRVHLVNLLELVQPLADPVQD